MRVEINFAGDSHDAVSATDFVARAVSALHGEAERAGRALDDVTITVGQAAETDRNARRMAQSVEQIGQEARKSRRELEALKLAGVTGRSGVGVGPFGSGFGRIGLLGTAVGLGAATSGPLAGGAAALGVGALSFAGPAAAMVGVLVASLHGLGDAIGGDRQEFEKLSPATQTFVQDVRSLIPWLKDLQETAREGLLPGIDKGLHAALSPGTAGGIKDVTSAISGEVGKLFEEAGRGLGGPQFQQFLNDTATHGVTQLDDLAHAAGHFASALLTVDHAGQPLADWLAKVIDDGARFVDEYVQAADASGALGEKLGGAQHELELIGHLVGALGGAVVQLAIDLTPLGNEIIVTLTNALHGLADWLHRNHDEVVAFTTGALHALIDAIQVAWPIVEALAKALKHVVDGIGGWETAFQIVIGGAVVIGITNIATAVYGLRAALLLMNPELAALIVAAGLLAAFSAQTDNKTGTAINGHAVKSGASGEFSVSTGPHRSIQYDHGQWYDTEDGSKITEAEAAKRLGMSAPQLRTEVAQQTAPPGGNGSVKVSSGANRAGAPLHQGVLDFVKKVSGLAGEPLTITTGTNHNQYVKGTHRQSQHWTGDAADIGTGAGSYTDTGRFTKYGPNNINPHLTMLGQDALIAAGMPAGEARKQQGGVFNIGGYQIIFNSMVGGDHYNHLHVGVSPGTKVTTDTKATGTSGSSSSAFGTPPPFTDDKGANILPAAIRLAMAKSATTPSKKDDVRDTKIAIKWLRAHVGGFTGEDQINAYLELASLLGQLKSLGTAVKKRITEFLPGALLEQTYRAQGTTGTTTDDVIAYKRDIARLQRTIPHLHGAAHTAAVKELSEYQKKLAGVKPTSDDLSKLQAVQTITGRYGLARSMDVAQSRVLGGPASKSVSVSLVQELQAALGINAPPHMHHRVAPHQTPKVEVILTLNEKHLIARIGKHSREISIKVGKDAQRRQREGSVH